MAKSMILPAALLGHILPQEPCKGCGKTRRKVRVGYPLHARCTLKEVCLLFPSYCECGTFAALSLRMPTLQFYCLIGWAATQDIQQRVGKCKAAVETTLERHDWVERSVLGWIEKVMSRSGVPMPQVDWAHSVATEGPTEEDRVLFDLDKDKWESFVRMLGFDAIDRAS